MLLLLIEQPATVAHTANAQAAQWAAQASNWQQQAAQWHAIWGWELGSTLVLLLLLIFVGWQNAHIREQTDKIMRKLERL